ncbi:hypothetical protein KKC94_05020 [Patescibacteria group bacterium]|nr:hypothetical protein [Patescibacteria group bacterium]
MKKILIVVAICSFTVFAACNTYSIDKEAKLVNEFVMTSHENPQIAFEKFLAEDLQKSLGFDPFVDIATNGFLSEIVNFIAYENGSIMDTQDPENKKENFYGDFLFEQGTSLPGLITWQFENGKRKIYGFYTMNYYFNDQMADLFNQVQEGQHLDDSNVMALQIADSEKYEMTSFIYDPDEMSIEVTYKFTAQDESSWEKTLRYTFGASGWSPVVVEGDPTV